MAPIFPSPAWLDALHEKLNSDPQYAQIASAWEGDICIFIEPDEAYSGFASMYFDLWHGTSRGVRYQEGPEALDAAFQISAPFSNWLRILRGELHPVQALATMKLKVNGNMAYIMRNVPTVLDFTRCARETPHRT